MWIIVKFWSSNRCECLGEDVLKVPEHVNANPSDDPFDTSWDRVNQYIESVLKPELDFYKLTGVDDFTWIRINSPSIDTLKNLRKLTKTKAILCSLREKRLKSYIQESATTPLTSA